MQILTGVAANKLSLLAESELESLLLVVPDVDIMMRGCEEMPHPCLTQTRDIMTGSDVRSPYACMMKRTTPAQLYVAFATSENLWKCVRSVWIRVMMAATAASVTTQHVRDAGGSRCWCCASLRMWIGVRCSLIHFFEQKMSFICCINAWATQRVHLNIV